MGMPITVELIDASATTKHMENTFAHFQYVDETFSTYKPTSEVSRMNNGTLSASECSDDVRVVLDLAEATKRETEGYFDINRNGHCDPSGLVKGWAIENAAKRLRARGMKNFFVEAGGDIAADGVNSTGRPWIVGIRHPFNQKQIIKVVALSNMGIATSGTYIRGKHIYNPNNNFVPAEEMTSLTVVGPNIYDADRYATAAFAMGKKGILFIERLDGFEGYMVDPHGTATLTSGFEKYVLPT